VTNYQQTCQSNRMKRNLFTIALAASLVSGCSHSGSDAHTAPTTENIKGQHFTTTQLVDAGNTTPEAALESSYWALFRGHYDAYIASYVPQAQKKAAGAWGGDKAKFAAAMQKRYAYVSGLQILARKTVADDKVELKYRVEFQNQAPSQPDEATKIAILVKEGSAWGLPEDNGKKYEASWDEGSQPEPQP